MMEKYFPVDVIHITHPDIEIQIGNFFVEIGNMDLFHKYMLHASERTDLNLQQSYFIGQLLLENSNQIKYAIDHFYKRNLLVSIKVTRTPSYTDPTMAYLKENVDFELEQTGCIIKDFNGLREHYYVSFRKVKD